MTEAQKVAKLMRKAEAATTKKKARKILKKYDKLIHSNETSDPS